MSTASGVEKQTRVLEGLQFEDLDFNALVQEGRPCIFKGALHSSPLVAAGKSSTKEALSYLKAFANDRPVLSYTAAPEEAGRFFYNSEINGINFVTEHISLATFFEKLEAASLAGDESAFYVGSAEMVNHFPGLLEDGDLQLKDEIFGQYPPRVGIWLGNRTTAATHFDVSNNIAASMVGRRRFTLFPPDQINNLYPGPLEPTPGGQVVSMVNLNAPDFEKFPKAKEALATAEVAELEAGDVLVYPAMWWHQVEALDDFNVMINYWWNPVPGFVDDPMTAVLQGILSLRDRPEHEREAWRSLFDFYVFGDSDRPRAHLPEHAWGALGPLDSSSARRLRAQLIKKINR